MITLAIEASTYTGSVALMRDGALLGSATGAMRGREHEALMPAVATLIESFGLTARDLHRVVCGAGPGAFTSLRVAGAIAKGLCFASGAQLLPVSSLALIVASRSNQHPERCLAVLDAMRGESYSQLFETDEEGGVTPLEPVRLVSSMDVETLAFQAKARAIGPQRAGVDEAIPHAAGAAFLRRMIDATEPADLAAWEPGYGRLAEAQVKWEAAHGRPLQDS